MKILSVVGARPNFMKISPFINEINKYPEIEHMLVHTGQHYDDRMSKLFFKSLCIPDADINLGIGSGSHSEQVGKTMIEFEKVLLKEMPDWVVVVGDVNATIACSISAKKLNIKVCHIEAGLRSQDENMPEEINRMVTDRISDLLLTPDIFSTINLKNEGIKDNKVKFVGNIMIDTLDLNINKAKKIKLSNIISENIITGQTNNDFQVLKEYGVITMHRPSNVDEKFILSKFVNFFCDSKLLDFPLIWTIHPRTEMKLKEYDLWKYLLKNNRIFMLKPLSYHSILKLNLEAKMMFTDSGGIQEECTVLKTPCITLRSNTERPVTLLENGGVSILVGNEITKIKENMGLVIQDSKKAKRPKYWDGKTSKRCLEAILDYNFN